MSLIALLIALILERGRHYHARWLWRELSQGWFVLLKVKSTGLLIGLAVVFPTLLVAAVQWGIRSWLFGLGSLLLWILVPLLVLGCPALQRAFRDYLQLSSHQPESACQAFNQQLSHLYPDSDSQADDIAPLQQSCRNLCWINYRYYFAVVFWFTLGGPTLAACYGLLRSLQSWLIEESRPVEQIKTLSRLMHYLDWLPSRLSGLSYVVASTSAKGFKLWLSSLSDGRRSNSQWLGEIAEQCREHVESPTCTQLAMTTIHLLKASMLLVLVVISLLTLYGWLV